MQETIWDLKVDKTKAAIKEGKRLDGRKLDQGREVKISNQVSENADGAARVFLGETDVIAGVKMILGEPYPDSPDQGTIAVGTELLPLASPDFETGPPREGAIELARVVDRGIRESKTLDFKKLCIREGELVRIVFFDIYTLSHDGNLFDAASIAAISALLNARVPKVEDDKIVKGEYSGKLQLSRKPVLSTFAKIADKVVLDPILSEEKAMDARFSCSTTEDDFMCAFQKGGPGAFTVAELDHCIETSFKRAKEIRKLL